MAAAHNILLLAVPDGQLLDVTGPLQMFAGANDELGRTAYRIEIAAPEAGPFATSAGVRLVADLSFAQVTSRRLARAHTLLTVGGEPGMRKELARGIHHEDRCAATADACPAEPAAAYRSRWVARARSRGKPSRRPDRRANRSSSTYIVSAPRA
jgi:transcriptional regulator GlxA family with amidase domain